MTDWTLNMVLEATGGQVLAGGGEHRFTGVATDSRTIRPGELFVPLKGEHFNGHEFVAEAVGRGAAGAIIAVAAKEALEANRLRIPVVGVKDTLAALGDLAGYWRRRHSIPVVAITGSNGKTTTKEMVAAILGRSWKTLKNEGNFNNLIGVPLTLFQLNITHQAAVVEMGMNRPGEIQRLTAIAGPDVGLITNIQPAHLEGLGSLDGIQAAKGELFATMAPTGTIVVNRDDPRVLALASSFPGRQVGFSAAGAGGEVGVEKILSMDAGGTRFLLRLPGQIQEIMLPVLGRHHLINAVAAAAVAWSLGLPAGLTTEGLAEFRPFDKRMQVLTLPGDVHIINDTYNANPGSMTAALETLLRMTEQGRSFAVLGDMLEMGPDSARLHRQLGRFAAGQGVDYLLAMGAEAAHLLAGAAEAGMPAERLFRADHRRELALRMLPLLGPGDWILVKGSRAMRMEKVVEDLEELLSDAGPTVGQRCNCTVG